MAMDQQQRRQPHPLDASDKATMDTQDTALDLAVASLEHQTAMNERMLLDTHRFSDEAELSKAKDTLKAQKKHEEAAEELVKKWQTNRESIRREMRRWDEELHKNRKRNFEAMEIDLRHQKALSHSKLLDTAHFSCKAGLDAAKDALLVQKKYVEAAEEHVKKWRFAVEWSRHQSKENDKDVAKALAKWFKIDDLDKKKRQREEAIDVDAEAGSEKAEPHK